MKKIIWMALLLGLTAGVAHADRFYAVRYQCSKMTAQHDGITCKVADLEQGPTLRIRIYGKETDPKPRRERTRYLIATITHNFIALGGVWTEERVNRADGRLMQRSCPRNHCNTWYPVKP